MIFRATYLLLFISLCPFFAGAQLLVPPLEATEKVSQLSEEADESNLFPFLNGDGLYFYRTYLEESNGELEIIRQNIWYAQKEKGEWAKPDRLFRMGEYPGENVIIGTNAEGSKVYLLNTIYLPEEDEFKSELKYLERDQKGRWSALRDLEIPGFEIGDRYAHLHLNQAEDIFLISISESKESENEDLFVSLRTQEGKWSPIIDLGPSINTNRAELTPFVAKDKKTLFFSSEGHNSIGGTDIFAAYRLDDSWQNWTQPVNLGDSVNSRYYDENFVLLNDSQVYFTSTGNSETADIYMARMASGAFKINQANAIALAGTTGIQLGIDVAEHEVYQNLITKANGEFTYMIKSEADSVTLRPKGYQGEQSVFIYQLSDQGEKISRQVFDQVGNPKMEVKQKILARLNCPETAAGEVNVEIRDVNEYVLGTFRADENGVVEILTDSVDRLLSYNLNQAQCKLEDIRLLEQGNLLAQLAENPALINKDQYKSQQLTTSAARQSIHGLTANEGFKVYFDFNAIGLTARERKKLLQFGRALKLSPEKKLSLQGFTDNVGSEEVNLEVGAFRAATVKKLLIELGINESQIRSESFGEESPNVPNQDAVNRAKNRRVEIILE